MFFLYSKGGRKRSELCQNRPRKKLEREKGAIRETVERNRRKVGTQKAGREA